MWIVSGNFFDVLGVSAALGRTLTSAEDVPNSQSAVTISHALWRDRFGADPSIVGQTLTLDGRLFVISGVAPRGFAYPPQAQMWVSVAHGVPIARRQPIRRLARDHRTDEGRHHAGGCACRVLAIPLDELTKRYHAARGREGRLGRPAAARAARRYAARIVGPACCSAGAACRGLRQRRWPSPRTESREGPRPCCSFGTRREPPSCYRRGAGRVVRADGCERSPGRRPGCCPRPCGARWRSGKHSWHCRREHRLARARIRTCCYGSIDRALCDRACRAVVIARRDDAAPARRPVAGRRGRPRATSARGHRDRAGGLPAGDGNARHADTHQPARG